MAKYDKLMLSRRLLRVKAMQLLYAERFNDSLNFKGLKANLETSVRSTYCLYAYHFWTLRCLAERIEIARSNAASSLLPENKKRLIDTKLLQHPFIASLIADEELERFIKREKLLPLVSKTVISALYKRLINLKAYQDYLKSDEAGSSLKTIRRIVTKTLDKSDIYQDHLDEHFTNLPDDGETVNIVVSNTIGQFYKNPENFTVLMPDLNWEEKNGFAYLLLDKTLNRSAKLEEMIMGQVVNWKADRITPIDKLLLKMALVELLYCPTVPIKVTINEYIDISKTYSTPKSKEFINGILDQLQQRLKKEGKIKKEGRGLLNFKVKVDD